MSNQKDTTSNNKGNATAAPSATASKRINIYWRLERAGIRVFALTKQQDWCPGAKYYVAELVGQSYMDTLQRGETRMGALRSWLKQNSGTREHRKLCRKAGVSPSALRAAIMGAA